MSLCKRYASQSSGLAPGLPPASSGTALNPARQLYDPKADKMDMSTIQVIGAINTPSGSGHSHRSRSSSSSSDRSHCYRCGATDHYVSVCPVQPRPGSPPKPACDIPVSKGWPGCKQMGRRSRPLKDDSEWERLNEEINLLGVSTVLNTLNDYQPNHCIDTDSDSGSLIHY